MSYSIQSDTSNQLLHLHLRPAKRFPKPCVQALHASVRRTKISTHEYLFPLPASEIAARVRHHSTLTPASFTTLRQTSISFLMVARNCSGVPPAGSKPSF